MNKTETPVLLSSAELDAVGGGYFSYTLVGWCGNEPLPLPPFNPPLPDPEPWYRLGSKLDLVALNPQPLPPRQSFLAFSF